MAEVEKQKFPSEVIDLPSEGKLYPKEHPCSNGKLEIKYMTAREEDILTSPNLIKKGVVMEKLLDSLIITEGVKCDDLLLGDKNAVLVAARILAYGPEYNCIIANPNDPSETRTHTFNLADCPFIKIPDTKDNPFELQGIAQVIDCFTWSGAKGIKFPIQISFAKIALVASIFMPDITTPLSFSDTTDKVGIGKFLF